MNKPPGRPDKINPADIPLLNQLSLDEHAEVLRAIQRGKIIVTQDVAPGAWFEVTKERITHAEYAALSLSEKHLVNTKILAGRAELVVSKETEPEK